MMSHNSSVKPQAAAFKIWKELGHLHPNEVQLEDLAMMRGALVISGGVFGATGRLTRDGENGIIRYNEQIRQEGRKRFTIAHELGHWEMHADKSQFIVCNESDMRDYGRSPMEVEANMFAAELLMPARHFRAAACNLQPSLHTVKQLANEFQTTLTATAIRLADISQKNLQVVWSENGIIKWIYMKKNSKTHKVKSGRLPAYCSANLPENQVADYMDHYDQAEWFSQFGNSYEVMEHTFRMKNPNACITLLEIN